MPTEAQKLPPQPPSSKLMNPCPACKRGVIRAVDNEGNTVVVELTSPGRGNIGLVAPLIGTDKLLAFKTSATATRYRVHHCDTAFSAASWKRKKPGAVR